MKTSGAKRIAERYVKALFDVSTSAKAVDAVEHDLNGLGALLEQGDDFHRFLNNPLLSHTKRAEVMLALLTAMQVHQLTRQFIGMLLRQKRLAILPDIIVLFAQWAADARGELRGELVSAAPMKAQQVEMIGERISRAYGKKTRLDVRQDPELLGGIVLKIGSVQMDGSLAGKMRRLKIALQAA